MYDICHLYVSEGRLLNLMFQPMKIEVEIEKTEFLEIVNLFIEKHKKSYNKFCRGMC